MIQDVHVNQEECIGCGDCARTCPGRFRLTYKVLAEVRGKEFERHRKKMLAAYAGCPVQAIELSSDDPSLLVVWHPARIIGKTRLTETIMEVQLETGLSSFEPGQYVTIRLRDQIGYFNRAYSIVALHDGILSLCVTLVEGGRGSSFFKNQAPGSELEVTEPRGKFQLKKTSSPKIFVGTGAGLAPLLSMMESCPEAKKTLYFGQRNEQELFYLERLEKIPNLEIITCLDFADDDWTGPRGRVTECIEDAPLARHAEVYTCGSDTMMNDLEKVLKKKRHSKRFFFKESFSSTYSSSSDEAGLRWRQWIRNIHVYTSLIFSILFLFFGFSGFLAGRSELFSRGSRELLPANIAVEKGELAGFYKAKFGEGFSLTGYSQDGDTAMVTLQNPAKVTMEVELDSRDRSYTVTEYHPLPPELMGLDAEMLAMQLSKQHKGKLDVEDVSEDEGLIYFALDSVWVKSFIAVDRGKQQYEMIKDPVPLLETLILLHRGEAAAPYQKTVMDVTAWAMVVATLTGIMMIFQSKSPQIRLVAAGLMGLSIVVLVVLFVNR